jgi:hypothetical protein
MQVDSESRTRVDQDTFHLTLILDPVANLASLVTKPEGRVMWQAPMAPIEPGVPAIAGRPTTGDPSAVESSRLGEVLEIEDLGRRSIEGVASRGSRLKRPDSEAEWWIAEGLGIITWSREAQNGQEITYRIYDVRPANPPASTFEVRIDRPRSAVRRTLSRLRRLFRRLT